MNILRQMAFGVCALCAAGGILQIFWPQNGYKPVINTVLVLYIITSVLQMRPASLREGLKVDWSELPRSTIQKEYREYADQVVAEASSAALQQTLTDAGIQASVQLVGGVCQVHLREQEDAAAAKTILETNAGTMPYEILTGGDAS